MIGADNSPYAESNSGIFTVNDIVNNNSTVAHEYGHSLGWFEFGETDGGAHDAKFEDGVPGIMAARGTALPDEYGFDTQFPGRRTIDPNKRRVKKSDVLNILGSKLGKLSNGEKVNLGKAVNIMIK